MDEKLKKTLECCSRVNCCACPKLKDVNCMQNLYAETKRYIDDLEERIAIMQESMEALEKRLADHDRIKVIRCADCAWWEANNAEEGDTSGYCRKNAECENALTDMTFFCGSAEMVSE